MAMLLFVAGPVSPDGSVGNAFHGFGYFVEVELDRRNLGRGARLLPSVEIDVGDSPGP